MSHTMQEWRVCNLAVFKGVPWIIMKMNTSVRERRAPQQHTPHGVEGNQIPHTGPKAFAAVEQNEARKQSTTTLQAIRQGN